jgi:hypothetical protein
MFDFKRVAVTPEQAMELELPGLDVDALAAYVTAIEDALDLDALEQGRRDEQAQPNSPFPHHFGPLIRLPPDPKQKKGPR